MFRNFKKQLANEIETFHKNGSSKHQDEQAYAAVRENLCSQIENNQAN